MQHSSFSISRQNRYGESGSLPQRKSRFYTVDDEWYFLTREHGVFGPYPHFSEAKQELKLYLRRHGIVKLEKP